jgi:fatty acid desaturase
MQIQSKEFHHRLNALRALDNYTNWFYLAREYLWLTATVVSTIAYYEYAAASGLGWIWYLPVTALAIVLIGAGQHRLATLGHEACHYLLFRNRLLNELVSDWFCMFPLLTGTHLYRITHLAHHLHVNDRERDPDLAQLEASGHAFEFPMPRGQFIWHCVLKQLLVPGILLRYLYVRVRYNALGAGTSALEAQGQRSRVLLGAVVGYFVALVGIVALGMRLESGSLLLLGPGLLMIGIVALFIAAPESWLRQTRLRPDIPSRYITLGRVLHLSLVFLTLAWLTYLTSRPWALYYCVLWLLPLGSTFAFFMMLRQVVQHANSGRDRLTNTRVFHAGLLGLAVFPIGMDYHLPHHLFPLVPHYRLAQLHALLMETEEYRKRATVVNGYFLPKGRPPRQPTVLDIVSSTPT